MPHCWTLFLMQFHISSTHSLSKFQRFVEYLHFAISPERPEERNVTSITDLSSMASALPIEYTLIRLRVHFNSFGVYLTWHELPPDRFEVHSNHIRSTLCKVDLTLSSYSSKAGVDCSYYLSILRNKICTYA